MHFRLATRMEGKQQRGRERESHYVASERERMHFLSIALCAITASVWPRAPTVQCRLRAIDTLPHTHTLPRARKVQGRSDARGHHEFS
jgi:hypothetical protein